MSENSGQRASKEEIETGLAFRPSFDADGLIPAIVTDEATGEVLMLAYMNQEALDQTIASRYATFWSRSRGRLWTKGEESGNRLAVSALLTDCDQDTIWIRARIEGKGVACHTGAKSCFYREIDLSKPSARPAVLKPPRR
ncbi:MAG: phosphoribosyl-AMP cyclohydrolase [Hyphomicrobiaceae bacterium]|nr:MAG: phosphoribosyl-AMP cyclohydrolase [Hyphomicrobiaceae bacterium]